MLGIMALCQQTLMNDFRNSLADFEVNLKNWTLY